MKKWMLPLALGVLLVAGCSTTSMKGTPFYSGEYQKNEGPAADRINLWPLLYYRDSALSVLWPIMEFSPEHQAVRPIYSGYDLDTDHPVYNVLWPVSCFDPARDKNRIFPVYWGDDYFNVFPLYWHEGQPLVGNGHDILFPLWIWQNSDQGNSLHLAWPLYARHRYDTWHAWHLWPVYDVKQTPDRLDRYVAGPLIHSYTNATESGSWCIPLYAYEKTDARKTFISLPYSCGLARQPGGKSWDLALPLWHRTWLDDELRWVAIPALSWGGAGKDWSDNWYLLGIGRWGRWSDSLHHHLIPLYYYDSTPEEKAFYTLPWWRKQWMDGSGFSALVPFYYHGYADNHTSFYSLPWMRNKYDDGSGWHASFPFYYRGYSEDASSFYSLPWFSKRYADGSGWHTTIPLYYHGYATNASAFYSPVWMSEDHLDGTAWQAAFPFYYEATSADGSIMVTPFYARKHHNDGSTAWRCYVPLVYFNDDYDAHFMTLLGGRWRLGDRQNWYVLPLLSGGAANASAGRNIYLGGLAAQRWDETGSSHYVFPLYYRAPQRGTFVSLPYLTWGDMERKNHVIPPLLSGWYSEDALSRGFWLAGLAGNRSGEWDPYHYVFPLYYAAPKDGTFLSIPYSAWRVGDCRHHLILPLLSGWCSGDDNSSGVLLAGLAGYRKGGDCSYSYVIPFYFAAPEQRTFLSIPFATWATGDRQNHAIPLLLSGWSTSPDSTDTFLLGGLGFWRQGIDEVEGSHLLPFYLWARDEYFYSLPYGWNNRKSYFATPLVGRYESGSGKSGSWAIPFYWHRRNASGKVKGYYFPLGYYNHTTNLTHHGFMGLYDYSRSSRPLLSGEGESAQRGVSEFTQLDYLLFFGTASESWQYAVNDQGEKTNLDRHAKEQSFFPLWAHRITNRISDGNRLETSSILGLLYDTRHEESSKGGEEHDYLRRRVLWRLFHYEKINGDMSTDIFPTITVDSYKNGYYKFSIFWRLFRYEKDPEKGGNKLDLLFIPLER